MLWRHPGYCRDGGGSWLGASKDAGAGRGSWLIFDGRLGRLRNLRSCSGSNFILLIGPLELDFR